MMDYVVELAVLENYFREDNNHESEIEKRDDQKEVPNKDEAEDEEYENAREQQFVDCNTEETEWNAAETELCNTYRSPSLWVVSSDSSSTDSNNSDDEQTTSRCYIAKIKQREINSQEKLFDISYKDDSDTEFIEKSEIEPSEKSLKLELTNPDLL